MRLLNFILAGAIATSSVAFAETNLPTVTIMGKTFYTYVAKKGESLFGIANKFGWDPEILAKTNEDLDSPLSNGDLIYYPLTSVNKATDNNKKVKIENNGPSNNEDKGSSNKEETVEPITIILASDEPVNLDPEVDTEKDGIVFHEVKEDESLLDIAQTYETTIEDIYKMNPGLSYDNPEAGETIRLKAGSRNENATPTMVSEEQVNGLTTYKVRRGDDWVKVAEKFNISIDLLKESNKGITKLKRGDYITVPSVETVEVERLVVTTDPREMTDEGRKELYKEVHSLDSKIYDADGNINPDAISVAIILGDPESNRDMEFARGAILAVNDMKSEQFATRLTVIDGSLPEHEVVEALEGFNPRLIITTVDKDLPSFVTSYAKDNFAHVINSFDIKDDTYLNNSAVIQYLAPTSYFNEEVADYVADKYVGYNLLIAGKMEGSDTMGESVIRSWIAEEGNMPEEVLAEEIGDLNLQEEDGRYLIYATPSSREDVRILLERIENLRVRYPLAEITVLGRPNWITLADALRPQFENNQVLLPTRFYFNAEDPAAKRFISSFKDLYGHTPMKSYPVYSATAYDILSYFLPNISMTGGDFNAKFRDRPTLQSPIILERVNNWGGVVNPCVYMVEFRPFGTLKKITLNSAE